MQQAIGIEEDDALIGVARFISGMPLTRAMRTACRGGPAHTDLGKSLQLVARCVLRMRSAGLHSLHTSVWRIGHTFSKRAQSVDAAETCPPLHRDLQSFLHARALRSPVTGVKSSATGFLDRS
eukprot:6201391-Pleurochrysis_carterae.AAC.2